ncbi:hypothetical protein BOX15_Mlig006795g2 [Macrostomum lignano]|uniref:WSC domain-containing protein n=2 Tax=Macrostomum lignano TaxID=282301 RepID=A0A1I8HIL7_9PLAT|nr:hypothetical protein BOX15_Mlig006795g2 [Macrostomum lignano]
MQLKWLVAALILSSLTQAPAGTRIYKSRKKVIAMVGGRTGEAKLHFSSCEQSSNTDACVMAIDDSVSDEFSQCAHTDTENKASWKGYLENPAYVSSVRIINSDWRRLGMKDGLMEFTISGGGEVCYTHLSNTSFLTKTFPCDILTSYIEIKSTMEDAAIVVCDVQVRGATLSFPTILQYPPPKIELSDCDQSSIKGTNNCWFAVDGNSQHQHANKGYCAMSQLGEYEWWSTSFKLPAIVQQVILYNRIDCCQQDLTNFAVTVSAQRCGRYNSPATFNIKSFRCNLFGSNVRVQHMSKTGRVTLCEVQVLGHTAALTPEQLREYKGCFKDSPKDPDLSDFKDPVSLSAMEVNKCDRICRRLGKRYFGIQGGMQCWCGSKFGKHGKVPDSECGMPCEGRHLQYCGGDNRNLVFELL